MKRFTSLINKRTNSSDGVASSGDSPEANVARGVRLFCESGGPNNSGEEVLHLPVIVDAAESSPVAAKEAANVIRKFLSKENNNRAYVQYNAIMLVRILADNPGKTFTRNLDGKFVATTKELLKDGRDMSVQQILQETLETFQMEKGQDETLAPLIALWQNEKAKAAKKGAPLGAPVQRPLNAPPFNQGQNYFAQNHRRSRGLPAPHELASRIEEAKTSGKLLLQVVQSTPPNEILGNELIKEFVERCQSASRSIQGYINCDNPAPDEDTLLTLIETNDQLSVALSKHQRAVLQARKMTGGATPSPPAVPPRGAPAQQDMPPPGPPPSQSALPAIPPAGPPPRLGIPKRQEKIENPFDYPNQAAQTNGTPAALQKNTQTRPYQGYQSTPSYVQRQESSTNNLTMHGAGHGFEDEPSPDENRKPVQYRF